MSRFSERLERDLTQIADRAAPSSTAWESIRRRIDAAAPEPETEIIMLSPGHDLPERHRRTWLLASAAALVAVLAVGLAVVTRSGDGEEPATTEVPAPTAPTTVPGPEYLGIVWESAADPARVNTGEGQPELVDEPLSIRVDMFVITPGPDQSQFCAEAVDEGATGPSGEERVLPEVDSCLVVEWQFDVGEEAANNGFMDAGDAVTPDGEEVEPLVYDLPIAPPGRSASGTVVYPNIGPGSRIPLGYSIDLADGGVLFERWDVVVPDTFQPIDWFDDES